MIVFAALEHYAARTKFSALDSERYAVVRKELMQLKLPEAQSELPNWYSFDELLLDLSTDGVLLTELGIEFRIKRFKGCYVASGESHSSQGTRKTTIQVQIPNILLWNVDEVEVQEDTCTDILQEKLDAGWRILAICPPAAQRRPDYILGRQKPQEN